MINEVDGFLGDGAAPAIEAKYLVSQGDSRVTLQVSGVRSSTNRSLADEVWSQPSQWPPAPCWSTGTFRTSPDGTICDVCHARLFCSRIAQMVPLD